MTTVSYTEAAEMLGVSRSTVERRISLTRVPVHYENGRAHFDLETLEDAWEGRQAVRTRQRVGDASLSVLITAAQRRQLEAIAGEESLASATRAVLAAGFAALQRQPSAG